MNDIVSLPVTGDRDRAVDMLARRSINILGHEHRQRLSKSPYVYLSRSCMEEECLCIGTGVSNVLNDEPSTTTFYTAKYFVNLKALFSESRYLETEYEEKIAKQEDDIATKDDTIKKLQGELAALRARQRTNLIAATEAMQEEKSKYEEKNEKLKKRSIAIDKKIDHEVKRLNKMKREIQQDGDEALRKQGHIAVKKAKLD